ncbi:MAG: hypothetical protein M2R45_04756 [Verrucomicrobia subdivision 3 bacterium]|nr:hypothetical protein [Limisphaerales bacterium]MCS1415085.1 hypothetical protein [Limisphaerales bacterium]
MRRTKPLRPGFILLQQLLEMCWVGTVDAKVADISRCHVIKRLTGAGQLLSGRQTTVSLHGKRKNKPASASPPAQATANTDWSLEIPPLLFQRLAKGNGLTLHIRQSLLGITEPTPPIRAFTPHVILLSLNKTHLEAPRISK